MTCGEVTAAERLSRLVCYRVEAARKLEAAVGGKGKDTRNTGSDLRQCTSDAPHTDVLILASSSVR